MTTEGEEMWEAAKKHYENQTSKIEDEMTRRLKQKLEAVGDNGNEMFSVFTAYNKLLGRPKIRAAITQYQSKLLGNVQADIELLKIKALNESKLDTSINSLREHPDVSNKLIYYVQLSQKLDFYQNRVKEVLGDDWENQHEGINLKKEINNVLQRINRKRDETFSNWYNVVLSMVKPQNEGEGRKPGSSLLMQDGGGASVLQEVNDNFLLKIEQKGQKYQLALNFDEYYLCMWREYQTITRVIKQFDLPYKVELRIKFAGDEMERHQPNAMSLKQSLKTF